MQMPAGDGGVVNALFICSDRRIPKIRIQTRQFGNLIDKRILVAVDSWDRTFRFPSGHYIRTIGKIGDRATESEVCMCGKFVPIFSSCVFVSYRTCYCRF
jgi:exosome complex exonuclease DIS3/RRP44